MFGIHETRLSRGVSQTQRLHGALIVAPSTLPCTFHMGSAHVSHAALLVTGPSRLPHSCS